MSNEIGNNSSGMSNVFVKMVLDLFPILGENKGIIIILVRKSAHIFEFLILGIFTILLIKEYKVKDEKTISVLICFIIALFDELHQLFVIGRNGNIIDVLYDLTGSYIGIIILKVIYLKKRL